MSISKPVMSYPSAAPPYAPDRLLLWRHTTRAQCFCVLTHLDQVMPCKDSQELLSQTFPEVLERVTDTQFVTSAVSFLPPVLWSLNRSLNPSTADLACSITVSFIFNKNKHERSIRQVHSVPSVNTSMRWSDVWYLFGKSSGICLNLLKWVWLMIMSWLHGNFHPEAKTFLLKSLKDFFSPT